MQEQTPAQRTEPQNTPPHPQGAHKKGYTLTLVLCMAVALILAFPGSIFFLILFILIFPIFLIVCLLQIIFNKNRAFRLWRLKTLGMWFAVIVIGIAAQQYYKVTWRSQANQLVQTVENFQQHNGHYPQSPEEFAAVQASISSGYRIHYFPPDQYSAYPRVIYFSPNTLFDRYSYNFRTKEWEFFPD